MKDSPDKNATSILIIQGFVMHVGKSQTMISCPTSGRFDVRWKDATQPNIKKGQYITLRGKLITMDLGRGFVVVRAELLPAKTLKEIKKFIQKIQEVQNGKEV